MEVILAKHHGFCYGVKRAVRLAEDSIAMDGPSFTLGPIIHNPQMVERLAERGVGLADAPEDVARGNLIIRSHGVGPDIYQRAQKRGLRVIDATCPHVKKAQMAAHALAEDGYQVVIVGERHHPEVKSIFEWSGKNALIVETLEEAQSVRRYPKLGIVAQTTFSSEQFKCMVEALLDKSPSLRIERTICTATQQRQAAAIKIAHDVDCMLVIGGKNSANTTRLAELCTRAGCRTYHIETAEELRKEWFSGMKKVGMTAGASTPDWIIEEVCEKVQDMESLLKEETVNQLRTGDIVQGTVVGIHKNEVFVDVGDKMEGIIPLAELAFPTPENASDVLHEGDTVTVCVLGRDSDGSLELSKKRAERAEGWKQVEEAFEAKQTLEGKVVEAVKGGLVLSVHGIRGFVPASQVALRFIADLSGYVGQQMTALPIEIDKQKQRVVLSRRVLLEEERKQKEEEVFSCLEAGKVIQGTVKKLMDYGAFIDIGGIDGLAHISDLSWERVKHPSEVLSEGDEVSVVVKSFDREKKRISLSVKAVTRDPWLDKADALKDNPYTSGKVVKIMDFGVFVQLENGLEGLVRLPELSEKHIVKADEVVQVGDELKVKVTNIDKKNKKIALSHIKALRDAERAEYRKFIHAQKEEGSNTLGDQFGHLFND